MTFFLNLNRIMYAAMGFQVLTTTLLAPSMFLHQQEEPDDGAGMGIAGLAAPAFPLQVEEQGGLRKPPLQDDPDADCPFRNSPLYRNIYVYPDYGDVENGWQGSILSEAAHQGKVEPWPWLEYDRVERQNETIHYDVLGENAQYATELLIKQVMTHPKSCLRTHDPEQAKLFYVPYMNTLELRRASDEWTGMERRLKYGKAVHKVVEHQQYDEWENLFGLTSKYWKRNNGADHILVFGEPFGGTYLDANQGGMYRFVHTQKQLAPPIVVSIELTRAFVDIYPQCARKNILLPYPNIDGRWYNSEYDKQAQRHLERYNQQFPVSQALGSDPLTRPAALYYSAGKHGYCKKIRQTLTYTYQECSKSYEFHREMYRVITNTSNITYGAVPGYEHSMRWATFCPTPCGDSPSAKRMFDAAHAGCIPTVISRDFVWPFTKEFDPSLPLNGTEFSVRLDGQDFQSPPWGKTCQAISDENVSAESRLSKIPLAEIRRLQEGVRKASDMYSWYKRRPDLPTNPLRENVFPDGEVAIRLVQELEARVGGSRWRACKRELKSLQKVPLKKKYKKWFQA